MMMMANHRHKKVVKMAKGYRGRTNCFRIAVQRVEKALQYAYRDRKVRAEGRPYYDVGALGWVELGDTGTAKCGGEGLDTWGQWSALGDWVIG